MTLFDNSYLFGNALAGEQKFLCPLCGKGYTTRRGMKTHINYHSDARPHICTTCGAGFKARGKLYDHMKLVHTELVKKLSCRKMWILFSAEFIKYSSIGRCFQNKLPTARIYSLRKNSGIFGDVVMNHYNEKHRNKTDKFLAKILVFTGVKFAPSFLMLSWIITMKSIGTRRTNFLPKFSFLQG